MLGAHDASGLFGHDGSGGDPETSVFSSSSMGSGAQGSSAPAASNSFEASTAPDVSGLFGSNSTSDASGPSEPALLRKLVGYFRVTMQIALEFLMLCKFSGLEQEFSRPLKGSFIQERAGRQAILAQKGCKT